MQKEMIPNSIPIINFHKVDAHFEWGITRSTPKQFENILQYLKSNHYETISLNRLIGAGDLPEKPIVITFDDSYESVFTHAFPLMQKYGFTGTVFVIAGYVGEWNTWDVNLGWLKFKHLSWSQIAELLKYGFEIGSHAVHHMDLTRIDRDILNRELTESKQILEQKTGHPVQFVSYPFGRYNDKVVSISRSAGYKKACGCLSPAGSHKNDAFVLERKACYLFDGIWNLKAKINHSPFSKMEHLKLRFLNYCSYGTSLVKPSKFEYFASGN